ncbi:TPA: hypothetical protein JLS89_004295 [Escherichia coli]|nr:hypothetical protein [Escherichia coli]
MISNKKSITPVLGSLYINLNEVLTKKEILIILAEQLAMLEVVFGVKEFKIHASLECILNENKQALYSQKDNRIITSFRLRYQHDIETRKIHDSVFNNSQTQKEEYTYEDILTLLRLEHRKEYKKWKNDIKLLPVHEAQNLIAMTHRNTVINTHKKTQTRSNKEYNKNDNLLKKLIEKKLKEYECDYYYFRRYICSGITFISTNREKNKYFFCRRKI